MPVFTKVYFVHASGFSSQVVKVTLAHTVSVQRASFNQNESELVSELVIELYNFVSVFTRGFTRLGSKVIS